MEPEGSLPLSQEAARSPSSESDESTPEIPTIFP
jgi:hypothetical protein